MPYCSARKVQGWFINSGCNYIFSLTGQFKSRASSRLCWVERCNWACLVQSVKGLSPAYQIFNQYHEFLQDFVLYEFALMICRLVLCTGQQPMETGKTRKTGYPSFLKIVIKETCKQVLHIVFISSNSTAVTFFWRRRFGK